MATTSKSCMQYVFLLCAFLFADLSLHIGSHLYRQLYLLLA